ncbi:MAG: cell wall hydrolase [Sphingomonadales bacterium]
MRKAIARFGSLRAALPDRRHWPASLVLATLLLLYMFAALSLASFDGESGRAFAHGVLPSLRMRSAGPQVPQEAPPVPEPLAFRDMSPQDALAYNASIPLSTESNPAARSFVLRSATDIDRLRSIDCLTAAVYYEAAGEPIEGQRAVAQVVLNRLRHPAFPKTVCGVVFQGSDRSTGCQFTFTCDGSLARIPSAEGWARARKVAEEALDGKVYKPVGYATHYHTNWVVPYWSATLTKVANVGAHIFYRWEGGWGRPAAFRAGYAGAEPEIGLLQRLSTAHAAPPGELTAAQAVAVGMETPGVTPDDMKGRAVLRRYEPLRVQSAANARAELAKADVPVSMRWALTGDAGQLTATPLGTKLSKPAVASPPAAPAAVPAPAQAQPALAK